MQPFTVRPLGQADRQCATRFTEEHWGAAHVVAHGQVYHPHRLPGFVATDPSGAVVGLVTFSIEGDGCEVVTLNSVVERIGVGTALLDAVRQVAAGRRCRRVWLITTNDNLDALGFYQRRGFRLVAVHRDALERSRQLKPSIPRVADNGIPLHDEIELELTIAQPQTASASSPDHDD
jgi:GNAT superfamily N-acetyltransferase